jgi:hypothetical protein
MSVIGHRQQKKKKESLLTMFRLICPPFRRKSSTQVDESDIGSNTEPIGTYRNLTNPIVSCRIRSESGLRNPIESDKKVRPSDSIGFRNPDSYRISSDGRIRPDPIGSDIGFIDLGTDEYRLGNNEGEAITKINRRCWTDKR